ncbi:MAG: Rieske 2Fe-2S domain-containing protein [Azonexus sp.]|nr:Rieske 2Fe-2S domain-containing protein [Azonexus sp.]MDP3638233.1 Rieske 2Fe-2S domain-containing protein [Azonexus sp.]MDZ4313686.1 Rieske 2Fe-2S domain-containing protein [Azonexus sp.]
MVASLRLICASNELVDAGPGCRFNIARYGRDVPAFAIRFKGQVFGYLNECGHVPAQLDWQPGAFFDDSKLYLICSIHGALYAPETGRCLSGRCQGKGLKPLKLCEIESKVFLEQESNDGYTSIPPK